MAKKQEPYKNDLELTIEANQEGMKQVRSAARRGNGICGAAAAMDALGRELGLGTLLDKLDEEENYG